MSFKRFIFNLLGRGPDGNKVITSDIKTILSYKVLAFETCISLIASAFALAEFTTYEKGKVVRKENAYRFNVEPNRNQNAFEFWKGVISTLLTENEALIIQVDNDLYLADSFTHDEKVFVEDVYKNVVVRGYNLRDTFTESEVIYLKYNNKNIKRLIDSMYEDYAKLIGSSQKAFEDKNGKKVILELDSLAAMTEKEQEARKDLFENKFKDFFNKPFAVLPLGKGMKYNEVRSQADFKDSRDIKNLILDVYELTCSAFHVPVALALGTVSGLQDLVDSFIMLGVKPISNLVQKEINRKMYDKQDYANRTHLKINMQKIKLLDMQKMASTADIFTRIGVHTINDNLEMLDKEPLDEDWADQRFLTKNYSSVLDQTYNEGVKTSESKTEHTK